MKRIRAFSLVELLVVIAVIGILAALSLPAISRSLRRADQVQCLNNLRQIGISLQQFADDHHGRYPMQAPAADGGAAEATAAATERVGYFVNAVENFVAVERELATPKLLVCRADRRTPAESFEYLRAGHVSYFLASNAVPGSATSVLAVDRNLKSHPADAAKGRAHAALLFDATMHERRGNVLLADGRVEWLSGLGLPTTSAPTGVADEGFPESPSPNAPDGPPDQANNLPAVTISANRTPRMNLPPAAAGLPATALATNAPALFEKPVAVTPAAPSPLAFIPLGPANDPARSRGWWWLLALLVLAAWWYLRRREQVETETAVRGAPAGMVLQNAVAVTGTLAQTAGVKKFFTGAAINADLLVTMLDKHGINARQEFARELLRDNEDEFSRETIVFVPEADYDRAYQLFYAERQDEL